MAWAALDDGFHSNRKMLSIGLDGMGMFAAALSYCADQLTDGFVPLVWAEGIARKSPRLLDNLCRRRAWVRVDVNDKVEIADRSGNNIMLEIDEKGFVILDYLEYNPSSVEVEERRQSKSRAGRKGAIKRWQADSTSHSTSHSEEDADNGTSHGTSMATRAGGPSPSPSPSATSSDSNPSFVRKDLERATSNDDFMDVVQPLELTDPQLVETYDAWQRNPEAVEEIATKALSSKKARSKAAVFLNNLRDIHDDAVATFISEHGGTWPTGSRWHRSGAGGTYVRDPLGYDKPDYAVDWGRPSHGEIKRALEGKGEKKPAPTPTPTADDPTLLDPKEIGRLAQEELDRLRGGVDSEEPDLEPEPSLSEEPKAAA
jgi:hypothetical protein